MGPDGRLEKPKKGCNHATCNCDTASVSDSRLIDGLCVKRLDEFKKLLTNYHNASFDCGAWDDDDHEQYGVIAAACRKAKQEIIDFIQNT